MTTTHDMVTASIRRLMRVMCRVEDSAWHKIPQSGPLLLAVNHINFVELPVMYSHLMPRPITGFVKAENWENPFLRRLFELWHGIPLRRGEADLSAVRAGLEALEAGKILVVAPEGTRTGDGRLRAGHPGIVLMATKANVPVLPAAYFGNEQFWPNLRRLRRSDFHLRVGRPFYLDAGGARITRQVRQQMLDEIMYQIAALLPPEYRGCYGDLKKSTDTFLRFVPQE